MLMSVSLQNGGLNSSISIFSSYVWVIIFGVTYLDECMGPITITSTIRAGVHWVHILQFTLEFAVFEGFSCILLLFSKIFLHEVSPLVHGIRNLLQ